jgi:hypothetical protein
MKVSSLFFLLFSFPIVDAQLRYGNTPSHPKPWEVKFLRSKASKATSGSGAGKSGKSNYNLFLRKASPRPTWKKRNNPPTARPTKKKKNKNKTSRPTKRREKNQTTARPTRRQRNKNKPTARPTKKKNNKPNNIVSKPRPTKGE